MYIPKWNIIVEPLQVSIQDVHSTNGWGFSISATIAFQIFVRRSLWGKFGYSSTEVVESKSGVCRKVGVVANTHEGYIYTSHL